LPIATDSGSLAGSVFGAMTGVFDFVVEDFTAVFAFDFDCTDFEPAVLVFFFV
jgi:hypothetical protein